MKNIQRTTLALVTVCSIFICSCGPNNDKGSTDQESSDKEGAIDSTKIPNFDSSHASLSVPALLFNYDKAKIISYKK